MSGFDYSAAAVPVPSELKSAHEATWQHLRSPGTWWSGAERMAIAAESRAATHCAICRERKAALSPNAVNGAHDDVSGLPAEVVDTIHRIRTDPGRLSRPWFDRVIAAGLDDAKYVELVGVVALLAGIDYCAVSLGLKPFDLPEPIAGEPSRIRPRSAKQEDAWVPMIAPEDAAGDEADLYGTAVVVPNIMRALSLVPAEARALQRSSNTHYLPVDQISDPSVRKTLDRMQIELVAARVSAMNECFY